MKHLSIFALCGTLTFSALAADVSVAVPGAQTANGQKVLTFIAKDPPGQRCNGNLQVAAEVANEIGQARVADVARRLGVHNMPERNAFVPPSIALGSIDNSSSYCRSRSQSKRRTFAPVLHTTSMVRASAL